MSPLIPLREMLLYGFDADNAARYSICCLCRYGAMMIRADDDINDENSNHAYASRRFLRDAVHGFFFFFSALLLAFIDADDGPPTSHAHSSPFITPPARPTDPIPRPTTSRSTLIRSMSITYHRHNDDSFNIIIDVMSRRLPRCHDIMPSRRFVCRYALLPWFGYYVVIGCAATLVAATRRAIRQPFVRTATLLLLLLRTNRHCRKHH